MERRYGKIRTAPAGGKYSFRKCIKTKSIIEENNIIIKAGAFKLMQKKYLPNAPRIDAEKITINVRREYLWSAKFGFVNSA